MVVDELITLLGLKTDPAAKGEADGLRKLLGGVRNAATIAGAALISAAGAVQAYAAKTAAAIDESGKFADSIGVTYERLQELEFGIKRVGGSSEELRGDLAKLTQEMSSPIPGEFNQQLFMLGIATRDASGQLKSADQVLVDIAGRLQGMNKIQQQQWVKKLGLSQGTFRLLAEGRDGIADLSAQARKYGAVIDETAKKKAAGFQDSLTNNKAAIKGVADTIAVSLLPTMSAWLDKITALVLANKGWISAGISQIVEGVGKGFELFGNGVEYAWSVIEPFLGPVGDLVGGLDATQAIAVTVAAALTAVAVAAAAAALPFIVMAAKIAAVVLVLEDLYQWFAGGESVIGGWFDAFAERYPALTAALGKIVDWLAVIAGWFGGQLIENVKLFGGIALDVISGIVGLFADLLDAIEKALSGNPFEALWDFAVAIFDRIVNLFGDIGKRISDRIGDSLDPIFSAFDGVAEFIGLGAATPSALTGNAPTAPIPASVLAGMGGGSGGATTINQTINGAGNPRAVADEANRRAGLGFALQAGQPGIYAPLAG